MTTRVRAEIGIIGVGNLGSALTRGWLRGDGPMAATLGAPITVFDADVGRTAALVAEFGERVRVAPSAEVMAAQVDALVVSVKPQDLVALLGSIAPVLAPACTVISTAAGVALSTIRQAVGPGPSLFRVMPNLAVGLGEGVVALAPEPGTADDTTREVVGLLRPLGLVELLSERYFDAVTAVTGSGPGFVSLVVEGLEDGAVRAGLPRGVARRFVRQMVTGTAALLTGSPDSAAELKDAVASPGGTTMAGLTVLEERAVRGALVRAVEAAAARGGELARGLS